MTHISSAKPTTPQSPSANQSLTAKDFAVQFMDTTWRIVVPVILFAGLGLLVDRRFHIGPWMTLSGMVVGFVFAGLLVKKQLVEVLKQEDHE